ncbi:MAG: hypothetical protein H7312_23675 [Tardiphaga sp.]|nr:hypothetical protein [Tardiphaga sp.]
MLFLLAERNDDLGFCAIRLDPIKFAQRRLDGAAADGALVLLVAFGLGATIAIETEPADYERQ